MKKSRSSLNYSAGFTLLELLMVFVIIGALASIAIPQYASYRERALEAQCKANRYHIEMEENAYFVENGKPNLKIDNKYACPSGGIYAWLVMDPLNPHYPQVICSIHSIGSEPEINPPVEETPETPETPAPPSEEISPIQLTEDLIDYTDNLDLKKGIEKGLLSSLKGVKKSIEKEKTDQAIDRINKFIDIVKKDKGKNIKTEEAEILISEGEKILSLLK